MTAELIASFLDLDPSADIVLDVGCDSAVVSRFVARRCRRFAGVNFIPAMLIEADRQNAAASRYPAWFAAADGRLLPFPAGVFSKAYCSDMMHTLPNHEDALKLIRELLRVCRPGGEALVTSIPDVHKKFQGKLLALRRARWNEKWRVMLHLLIPRPAIRIMRRLFRLKPRYDLEYLEFDLDKMKKQLDAEGLRCDILDFPTDYWSEDYRLTRSNLLIRIPPDSAGRTPAPRSNPPRFVPPPPAPKETLF